MTYGELDRFLVPLDAPAARRYFNDALYVPKTTGGRIRRALGRPGLRRVEKVEGMEILLDQLGGFAYDTSIFIRDYDTSHRGRIIGLLFRKDEAAPFAVAKAQQARNDPTSLRGEAAALEQMRAFLPPELKATLPRVLRFQATPEGELLVVAGAPGRSAYIDIYSFFPGRFVDAHFDAAAKWLAAFHDATRSRATSPVGGAEVPLSASHGDFWPRNVLGDAAGNLSVVDWEHFHPAASPFVDLFHYPLTYGLNYFRDQDDEVIFRKTFAGPNRVSRAVQRYLRAYCERTEMPRELLAPALRRFVETHGRMEEEGPERPGAFAWEKFRSAAAEAAAFLR